MIACKQRLCKTCNDSGNYLNHAKHDAMFEKKWIYRIIYLTWILAAGNNKKQKNNLKVIAVC